MDSGGGAVAVADGFGRSWHLNGVLGRGGASSCGLVSYGLPTKQIANTSNQWVLMEGEKATREIIIIIFQYTHAACRLWRSYVHSWVLDPLSPYCLSSVSSAILLRSSFDEGDVRNKKSISWLPSAEEFRGPAFNHMYVIATARSRHSADFFHSLVFLAICRLRVD